MKRWLILLALLMFSAHANGLQTIDGNKWSYVYTEIAPKILVSCDCVLVTNPDGSQTLNINKFKSIRKVGGEIACVVGSPTDFFSAISGTTKSLLMAAWMGGGISWNSYDNGVTWWRMLPGNKYLEAPDSWCLQ